MHSASPILPFILLTAALLAGCLGAGDVVEEDRSETPEAPVVTATTGAIHGMVLTEDFRPLAGIEVALINEARTTTLKRTMTTGDGTYVLNDVAPGSYLLHASGLGFSNQQRPVNVVAGEITELSFQLAEIHVSGPWKDEQLWIGKVTLSLAWQVEPPGVGCIIVEDPTGGLLLDGKSCGGIRIQNEGDNGEVAIKTGETAKTVMAALVWTSAGPLGDNLLFDFMCADVPRGGNGAVLDPDHVCYFYPDATASPVVHRVDEEHWVQHGYDPTADWAARVFATYGMLGTYPITGIDIGVAYEQAFTIYSTVFHEAQAPEGYNPIPDS